MSYVPGQIVWDFNLKEPVSFGEMMYKMPDVVPEELSHLDVKPNAYFTMAMSRGGKYVLGNRTTNFIYTPPLETDEEFVIISGGKKLVSPIHRVEKIYTGRPYDTLDALDVVIDETIALLSEGRIALAQTETEFDEWCVARRAGR